MFDKFSEIYNKYRRRYFWLLLIVTGLLLFTTGAGILGYSTITSVHIFINVFLLMANTYLLSRWDD